MFWELEFFENKKFIFDVYFLFFIKIDIKYIKVLNVVLENLKVIEEKMKLF